MENEKRNRSIIITVVILLLLVVIAFAIYGIKNYKNKEKKLVNVSINQIYSSDYILDAFDNSFFVGAYDNKVIDVIIDSDGKEVFKGLENFVYDEIYKMKDGRYLIYSNVDNKFITYIFDGVNIKKFYEIQDVSYIKPIIYKGIDSSYIVGFTSTVDDDLYLYNLNSSGIIVIDNVSLLGDYSDNGVYYTYSDEYLIVKNQDNLMGVINISGDTVIECKYSNIINTYDGNFVVQNTKGKYGVIDKSEKELIKIKYKVVDYYKDYYLIVNYNNMMALYNNVFEKVIGFEMKYDTLIEYDLRSDYNSINLYKVDGKVVVLNNYLEDKNGIEYDKHSLYIIDGNKIIDKMQQVGFGAGDVIYTYDEEYNIQFYDNNFSLAFEFKLNDVKKINEISLISNNVYKVLYTNKEGGEKEIYLDNKGNKVQFDLGELVIKHIDYNGYLKNNRDNQVLSLYDLDGNYLDDISGTNIEIYGEYIIVDKCIYKIMIKE